MEYIYVLMDYCPHCSSTSPGDGLFCRECTYHIPGRTFATSITPPWGGKESLIRSSDTDTQVKATDYFLRERKEWTSSSERLRKWESDRKKEWAKNKPYWRKKRMKEDPLL